MRVRVRVRGARETSSRGDPAGIPGVVLLALPLLLAASEYLRPPSPAGSLAGSDGASPCRLSFILRSMRMVS